MASLDLSIVVPVYKEAENIRPFLARVESVLGGMSLAYEIIFAMDPSTDNTEEIIQLEIHRNNNIKLITFSRRFGQPAATLAGIYRCKGDACLVIDIDLQDPPNLFLRCTAYLARDTMLFMPSGGQERARPGSSYWFRMLAMLLLTSYQMSEFLKIQGTSV